MEVLETRKQVIIQPIAKIKFGGLSTYPKTITVLTTEMGSGGAYKTGLSKAEEREFEEKLGLAQGTLNKTSDFWSELEVRVQNKKVTLNLENPLDYLRYRICLESSKVANSMAEKHKWPSATFAIIDEDAVAKVENEKLDWEIEAYEKFMATTPDEKRGLLRMFGKRTAPGVSEAVIKTTLAKIMKQDPKSFVETINDKKLKTKILIDELLETSLITRSGSLYKNGDEPLGYSVDEVVDYLENPKHSSILGMLVGKLKSKKTTK